MESLGGIARSEKPDVYYCRVLRYRPARRYDDNNIICSCAALRFRARP